MTINSSLREHYLPLDGGFMLPVEQGDAKKPLTIDSLKVSIIVASYNEKDTIEALIKAVRSAPIKNQEIIIIDN